MDCFSRLVEKHVRIHEFIGTEAKDVATNGTLVKVLVIVRLVRAGGREVHRIKVEVVLDRLIGRHERNVIFRFNSLICGVKNVVVVHFESVSEAGSLERALVVDGRILRVRI
jgi:hypothetical protein